MFEQYVCYSKYRNRHKNVFTYTNPVFSITKISKDEHLMAQYVIIHFSQFKKKIRNESDLYYGLKRRYGLSKKLHYTAQRSKHIPSHLNWKPFKLSLSHIRNQAQCTAWTAPNNTISIKHIHTFLCRFMYRFLQNPIKLYAG